LDGEWTGDKNKAGKSSGCGNSYQDPDTTHVWPLPPEEVGDALIGYIDNEPFKIGCDPIEIVVRVPGELYLGMNDCRNCYWDNEGKLYVRISIGKIIAAIPPSLVPTLILPPPPLFDKGERGSVPVSGTQIILDLKARDTLLLTGGIFRVGQNAPCDTGGRAQNCVLAFDATRDQQVVITLLRTGENWYGISSHLTAQQAVEAKRNEFFQYPNCWHVRGYDGCDEVLVDYLTDGIPAQPRTIIRK
jgi:hypothetical protein